MVTVHPRPCVKRLSVFEHLKAGASQPKKSPVYGPIGYPAYGPIGYIGYGPIGYPAYGPIGYIGYGTSKIEKKNHGYAGLSRKIYIKNLTN